MENYDLYAGNTSRVPRDCTLKEYRKNYASEGHRKTIRNLAIVGYVLCGVNLLVALLVNVFALVDVVVLLALVLGMHIGKSKGCAVGILVYAIIGALLSVLSGGSMTGWGWIALGVCGINVFKKIDQEYQDEMARQSASNTGFYNEY